MSKQKALDLVRQLQQRNAGKSSRGYKNAHKITQQLRKERERELRHRKIKEEYEEENKKDPFPNLPF